MVVQFHLGMCCKLPSKLVCIFGNELMLILEELSHFTLYFLIYLHLSNSIHGHQHLVSVSSYEIYCFVMLCVCQLPLRKWHASDTLFYRNSHLITSTAQLPRRNERRPAKKIFYFRCARDSIEMKKRVRRSQYDLDVSSTRMAYANRVGWIESRATPHIRFVTDFYLLIWRCSNEPNQRCKWKRAREIQLHNYMEYLNVCGANNWSWWWWRHMPHTFDHFHTGGNLSGFYAFLGDRNTELLICCLPFFSLEQITKGVNSSPPLVLTRCTEVEKSHRESQKYESWE